jgi:hypothetical protein
VTITVACSDTGPAYERSEVRDFAKTKPSHGTLKQEIAGEPFVYTPNAGFTGTDSFVVGSFDEFGFGSDTGTVTITVRAPKKNGGGGGGGKTGAFGANTLVTVGLAARRIPAGGPLKVLVTNKNVFPITGRLSGKHRHVKLKAKSFAIGGRAKKTVKIKLPKPLQQVLSRKHELTLRLSAAVEDPAGHLRTVSKTVKPKLKR